MPQKIFRLVCHNPRQRDFEDEERSYLSEKKMWRDAQRLLRKFAYQTSEGVVEIEVLTKTFFRKFSRDKYLNDLYEMECVIRYPVKIKSETGYIRCFLEELFLILNIAVPGSCHLYLKDYQGDDDKHLEFSDFRLNSSLFEVAWNDRSGWSQIGAIPLVQVVRWFRELGIGSRVKAETPLEQALFSLLRISAANDVEIDSVIWLSQILESFCGSPPGKILNTMGERLGLILKPLSPMATQDLKKKLGAFYNMRSRFVHGDFKVLRRYPGELSFDDEVGSYVYKIMDNMDFGGTLAIALIQKFVREGWRDIEFTEHMTASPIIKDAGFKFHITKEKLG